ncbi:MAG: arylamine N-acetyltransferase [Bdellovibrionales bacterium]|nr:arylamine N-acetyltransferase [Bdellovibrionales bacterium]
MSIFDITFTSQELLDSYLARLGLKKMPPSLVYLNLLIERHQQTVPFENLTRINDFKEKQLRFSSLPESLEQIANGAGGVCWSIARAFRWLLKELGFETQYLFMEPGHVCLKVSLDQDYYVDVGYAAPFFQAMPLNQSFKLQTLSEEFNYAVSAVKVEVVRTPGPTKNLHLNPYTHEQIEAEFLKGNNWGQNKFLSETVILKYVNHKLVKLYGRVFTDFRTGEKQEKELSDPEINKILTVIFEIDPQLYYRARKWLL